MSGKSYIGLMYALKHADDPYYRGVIFRRTNNELIAQGGLWENACEMYQKVFGKDKLKINQKNLKITFPSGASIKFSYLGNDADRLGWQGSQLTNIIFDESTHFSRVQILYLMQRLRSAKSKSPRQMILTCNPDPDWFALDWIKPYLQEDGTPNQEMDGVVRYFVSNGEEFIFADTREELEEEYGTGADSGIQTFTFISATCEDNPKMLEADPGYVGRLKAQPHIDMQRNLLGNWFVRPTGSGILKREWFAIADKEPAWSDIVKTVRSFDWAGTLKSDTTPDPDYSACVKMSKLKDGTYFIHDIQRTRVRFGDWVNFVIESSRDDAPNTDIILPIDPNPAAAGASELLARELSEHGFYVRRLRASGNKVDRVRPFASMLLNGGIGILDNCATDLENGVYNDLAFFFRECDAFDGGRKGHDDGTSAKSSINSSNSVDPLTLRRGQYRAKPVLYRCA